MKRFDTRKLFDTHKQTLVNSLKKLTKKTAVNTFVSQAKAFVANLIEAVRLALAPSRLAFAVA